MTRHGKEGIGGWLIVVMIGFVIATLRSSWYLNEMVFPVFTDGTWEEISTPGSDFYHRLLPLYVILELIGHGIYVIYSLILIYLMLQKAPSFPKVAICFLWFEVAFAYAVVFLPEQIPVLATDNKPYMWGFTTGQLLSSVIWTAYFLKSTRVKNTFIDPRRTRLIAKEPVHSQSLEFIHSTQNGSDPWRR